MDKIIEIEEMLAYAYKHYILGVIFESFEDNNSIRRIKYYPGENTITWYIYDNVIRSKNGVGTDGIYCSNPSIYNYGKWAKILSSPVVLPIDKTKLNIQGISYFPELIKEELLIININKPNIKLFTIND